MPRCQVRYLSDKNGSEVSVTDAVLVPGMSTMIKKAIFHSLFMSLLLVLTGGRVLAQADETIEEVVVTGVKSSLTAAVEVKRQSMQIVDAIVAEDLGKFPDNNVVEAMQRIPGVQVTNRGAGEVTSVSIRGLSDVTTTVNGRNIFTSTGRSVALADVPSTLIKQVDVYKSRSADQISRGIAGGIDIHTLRPLDFDGFQFSTQLRTIYQEQAEEYDPNIAVLLSNTWDTDAGRFGALLNASLAKTNYRDQSADAGASLPFRPPTDPVFPMERLFSGWTPGLENGLPTAPGSTLDIDTNTEFVHARDAVFSCNCTGERERPAWNVALQWAPNDRSEYTAEVFYNGFRNEVQNALWFQFVDWWFGQDPANYDQIELYPGTNVVASRPVDFPFSFTSGDWSNSETDSYLYALRGEWQLTDRLNVVSDLYLQESKFKTDFRAVRTGRVYRRLNVDFNNGQGVPVVEYFDDPGTPQDESDPTDAGQYFVDMGFENSGRDKGDAVTWNVDGDLDVEWGPVNLFSFGLRWDQRDAETSTYGIGGFPVVSNNPNDHPGLMEVYCCDHFDGDGTVSGWAVADAGWIGANPDDFRALYGFPSVTSDSYALTFSSEETQIAAYVQADFAHELSNGGFIDGRVGLRYLDVETKSRAPNPDTGGLDFAKTPNDALLPNLMVRWGITKDLLARFSYTETFALPSFADLSPFIDFFPDVTDIGYGTAFSGNPDLEPEESENLDISLEWYFAEGSVLYGTWFRRDITNRITGFRNVITADDPNDNPDRGMYTFVLSQPDNVGEATLDGWEFGTTWFPELDGWLNGFGVQASLTILDSEQKVPQTDDAGNVTGVEVSELFGVSDTSYNVMLAYDREKYSARLSYFWREKFRDRSEAALFANPLAIWKQPEESLDFQLTWLATDHLAFTFDATNITEERFHENYGDMPLLFNFHNNLYSRTYALGMRYTFGK